MGFSQGLRRYWKCRALAMSDTRARHSYATRRPGKLAARSGRENRHALHHTGDIISGGEEQDCVVFEAGRSRSPGERLADDSAHLSWFAALRTCLRHSPASQALDVRRQHGSSRETVCAGSAPAKLIEPDRAPWARQCSRNTPSIGLISDGLISRECATVTVWSTPSIDFSQN